MIIHGTNYFLKSESECEKWHQYVFGKEMFTSKAMNSLFETSNQSIDSD